MKKVSIIILIGIMSVVLALGVFASAQRSVGIQPRISFSGTTAKCTASIDADNVSDEIRVTMKLLEDGITIKTWYASGMGSIYMNETASAKRGSTYKLMVTVSIDGETQPSAWVTKKCE